MTNFMLGIGLVLIILVIQGCFGQEEEDEGPYKGKFIGKLKSYHHQVSGDMYAIDDYNILLVDFNYDGAGDDAFFWAGDTLRAGPQGYIVPDEHGKTNVLERYINAEVKLSLPDGRRISRLKWFAVYDIGSQNVFGDVDIPEDWEAPAPRNLPPLSQAADVTITSQAITVEDASTILIKELRYPGGEEAYFWAGVGPQPSSHGFKIPDEYGYLDPLKAYSGEDVRLTLPGGKSIFNIGWLAIWDARNKRSLATLLLNTPLEVPPAQNGLHPYKTNLPNCKQLHRNYQVSWEVFGNQITFQVAGKIRSRDYMAFGISGSQNSSKMIGADVIVARFDEKTQRGFATDYNITDVAPCIQVLGAWKGVCRDDKLGGLDSAQIFSASREDGVTVVTYRRTLQPGEGLDLEWNTDQQYVVWALGPLDHEDEPAYHSTVQSGDLSLVLAPKENVDDCFAFDVAALQAPAGWDVAVLADPAVRVFDFRLGPAGGARGLASRPRATAAPRLAWYVRGHLAPDIQLRRGLTYTFEVFGGKDPHSASLYHPLVVTTEAVGGIERLSDQLHQHVKVLAGQRLTRRNRFAPTAAGALCLASEGTARPEQFATFRQYNRSLSWRCHGAVPAELSVSPDSTWPDTVYYHSFTHAGMGGRIIVVDRYRQKSSKSGAQGLSHSMTFVVVTVIVTLFNL